MNGWLQVLTHSHIVSGGAAPSDQIDQQSLTDFLGSPGSWGKKMHFYPYGSTYLLRRYLGPAGAYINSLQSPYLRRYVDP